MLCIAVIIMMIMPVLLNQTSHTQKLLWIFILMIISYDLHSAENIVSDDSFKLVFF